MKGPESLRGKRIAVVGSGYEGKRFIFERARQLGVEIVLLDKGQDHWARGLVREFIDLDTSEEDLAFARACGELTWAQRRSGPFDGITTFWENDVPLTARLAAFLGLEYHGVEAARAARSKFQTRRIMEEKGLPSPGFARLRSRDDLERAMSEVGFPAVLKPAQGWGANFVVRVDDERRARSAYGEIAAKMSSGGDPDLPSGDELIFEQYLDGPEYDADLVLQEGRLAFASVSDNWPTREPYFVSTGASLPSRALNPSQQKEAADLAYWTARALGFSSGVFHIEGKFTGRGARILEVNARMGGHYVHEWVKTVWGVDLVDAQFAVAAGIPFEPALPAAPLAWLEGEFIMPRRAGLLKVLDLPPMAKRDPAFQSLRVFGKPGTLIQPPYEAGRAGLLVARGPSAEEARAGLDRLRSWLIFDLEPRSKRLTPSPAFGENALGNRCLTKKS